MIFTDKLQLFDLIDVYAKSLSSDIYSFNIENNELIKDDNFYKYVELIKTMLQDGRIEDDDDLEILYTDNFYNHVMKIFDEILSKKNSENINSNIYTFVIFPTIYSLYKVRFLKSIYNNRDITHFEYAIQEYFDQLNFVCDYAIPEIYKLDYDNSLSKTIDNYYEDYIFNTTKRNFDTVKSFVDHIEKSSDKENIDLNTKSILLNIPLILLGFFKDLHDYKYERFINQNHNDQDSIKDSNMHLVGFLIKEIISDLMKNDITKNIYVKLLNSMKIDSGKYTNDNLDEVTVFYELYRVKSEDSYDIDIVSKSILNSDDRLKILSNIPLHNGDDPYIDIESIFKETFPNKENLYKDFLKETKALNKKINESGDITYPYIKESLKSVILHKGISLLLNGEKISTEELESHKDAVEGYISNIYNFHIARYDLTYFILSLINYFYFLIKDNKELSKLFFNMFFDLKKSLL